MYRDLGYNMEIIEFTEFCKSRKTINIVITSKGNLKINGIKITSDFPHDLRILEITSIEPTFICKLSFELGNTEYIIKNGRTMYSQIEKIIKTHYDIATEYSALLLKCFNQYFIEALKQIKSNIYNIKTLGWRNNTYLWKFNLKFGTELFDSTSLIPDSSKLDYFTNTVLSSETISTIFSYSICSISKYFQKEFLSIPSSNKDYDSFTDMRNKLNYPISLCITGKASKTYTKKDIANILCNFFINPQEKYSIKQVSQYPHFHIKNFETIFPKIVSFSDCPIIITPSANAASISSSSPMVKTIEKLQQERKLKFFPVYISDTYISRDYVINCNISTIDSNYIKWLKDNVHFIKSLFNNLLNYLIRLQERYPTDAEVLKKITHDNIIEVESIFNSEIYNTELSLCYTDLLSAFYLFCDYLSYELHLDIERVNILRERVKSAFCKAATDIEYTQYSSQATSYSDYNSKIYSEFIDFIKLAVNNKNTLKSSLSDKYDKDIDQFIYNCPNDCIYLDYEIFLSIFPLYLSNHGITHFTKSKISSLFCTCKKPLIERPQRSDGTIRELYWVKKGRKMLKLTNELLKKIC